jgi:amidase
MTDLMLASATSLAAAIREKRVSSVEVVDAHLARIEAVNPKLNAVVQLTADNARRRARDLDELLARGEIAGPLHGVPFTAKDWLDTNDAICAAGLPQAKERRPKHDATVVARMRAAGAVLLGKTFDGVNGPFNQIYGTCHNPYDLDRTPGESSSGEASIIAAGGSPFGLGSDSGGSIRYPAHCSGVAGLKPTAGRVPLTGHFPRLDSTVDTRTQIGPLARSIEDLSLALSIIAGPDGRDPGVAPVPLADWRNVDLRGMRVATFDQFAKATPDAGTRSAVLAACQALRDAGALVEESLPPRIDEVWDITMTYWGRVGSVSLTEWSPPREHTLTVDQIERGMFVWGRLRREQLGWLQSFDAVVCPASPAPAMLLSEKHDPKPFVYTLPFSLTGWPVVVVRAGTSAGGMPIGVQIAAQPWRDDVALAAARQVEISLGGWQRPPLD